MRVAIKLKKKTKKRIILIKNGHSLASVDVLILLFFLSSHHESTLPSSISDFYLNTWHTRTPPSLRFLSVFSRVHATLQPALSVRPLHYALRAHHLGTKKIKHSLLADTNMWNWCSLSYWWRIYMVLSASRPIQYHFFHVEVCDFTHFWFC